VRSRPPLFHISRKLFSAGAGRSRWPSQSRTTGIWAPWRIPGPENSLPVSLTAATTSPCRRPGIRAKCGTFELMRRCLFFRGLHVRPQPQKNLRNIDLHRADFRARAAQAGAKGREGSASRPWNWGVMIAPIGPEYTMESYVHDFPIHRAMIQTRAAANAGERRSFSSSSSSFVRPPSRRITWNSSGPSTSPARRGPERKDV